MFAFLKDELEQRKSLNQIKHTDRCFFYLDSHSYFETGGPNCVNDLFKILLPSKFTEKNIYWSRKQRQKRKQIKFVSWWLHCELQETFATFGFPIMVFVLPTKFYVSIVFNFFLRHTTVPWEKQITPWGTWKFQIYIEIWANVVCIPLWSTRDPRATTTSLKLALNSSVTYLCSSYCASPFYSYSWKRGWSWPCFNTTLLALLCKSCCCYAN